ncbi:MAG TPA: YigZ family protein [Ignavibacteriaceae bacterium]|nr:YigZ family protein [Ignavibacteriaceae bacterium]
MPQLEEILTISKFHETSFKEKGSLFAGQAYPVQNEEDFNQILVSVKKNFYDATHHCYAYKLIDGQFKYSDDGEPSGTAGVRILNAIDHFGITNVLVIVVRYFGGTKLGVGPLGKAYYASAQSVLNEAEKIRKTAYKTIIIEGDFSFTSLLHKTFADFKMKILDTKYTEVVKFKCLVKPKLVSNLKEYLIEKTSGSIKIEEKDEINYY